MKAIQNAGDYKKSVLWLWKLCKCVCQYTDCTHTYTQWETKKWFIEMTTRMANNTEKPMTKNIITYIEEIKREVNWYFIANQLSWIAYYIFMHTRSKECLWNARVVFMFLSKPIEKIECVWISNLEKKTEKKGMLLDTKAFDRYEIQFKESCVIILPDKQNIYRRRNRKLSNRNRNYFFLWCCTLFQCTIYSLN